MNRIGLVAVTLFVLLIATLSPRGAGADCVVLLHGLVRSSHSMGKLEKELRAHGYQVANVDYPSREWPIDRLSRIAVETGLRLCRAEKKDRIHFVTHSMGGILIRYYLANNEIENLGHVVMIAPPNHGSEIVDRLAGVPGFGWATGPAGLQLGTGVDDIPSKLGPVDYPVGVIAGTKSYNLLSSHLLPNADDGKVSVDSTKVAGMADFRMVPVSHPFIMRDETVIKHTLAFIKTGAFLQEALSDP